MCSPGLRAVTDAASCGFACALVAFFPPSLGWSVLLFSGAARGGRLRPAAVDFLRDAELQVAAAAAAFEPIETTCLVLACRASTGVQHGSNMQLRCNRGCNNLSFMHQRHYEPMSRSYWRSAQACLRGHSQLDQRLDIELVELA